MKRRDFFGLVVAIAISEFAGIIGAMFTVSTIPNWYVTLQKPALNPPGWIFGPVWTILYALIGIALYLVWKNNWRVTRFASWGRGKKSWNPLSERLWRGDLQKANVIGVFAVQYVLNILWSYLFFGLHSPLIAFFEILALWISILYVIVNFYRISRAAAWLFIPYLFWVSFAVYLNYSILALN